MAKLAVKFLVLGFICGLVTSKEVNRTIEYEEDDSYYDVGREPFVNVNVTSQKEVPCHDFEMIKNPLNQSADISLFSLPPQHCNSSSQSKAEIDESESKPNLSVGDRAYGSNNPYNYDTMRQSMYNTEVEIAKLHSKIERGFNTYNSYLYAVDNRITKLISENLAQLHNQIAAITNKASQADMTIEGVRREVHHYRPGNTEWISRYINKEVRDWSQDSNTKCTNFENDLKNVTAKLEELKQNTEAHFGYQLDLIKKLQEVGRSDYSYNGGSFTQKFTPASSHDVNDPVVPSRITL